MSEIDAFTIVAILVRALGYGAGALAVGSGLFLVAFAGRAGAGESGGDLRRAMARTARIGGVAAIVAVAATLAGLGVRAGRLSGLDLEGMVDATMLQIVWEGPVGTAVSVRLVGLATVVAGLAVFRTGAGRAFVLAGGLTYAYSYALVGHASEPPQWLLAPAVTVHLLAVSFWFGSFAPLALVTRRGAAVDAAGLLGAFGRTAIWVIGALVAAGATFAAVMLGSPAGLVDSAYGWIFMAKLALVTFLLMLAAFNKLRLVPALARGDERARFSLVRSIRLEACTVAAILLVTAALTSVATPPVRAAVAPHPTEAT
ncbi:MAG: hypothetical protein AcusKO_39750 [Acuticoccus sp.]